MYSEKNIFSYFSLRYLALVCLVLSFLLLSTHCSKPECEGPCNLVKKCADENAKDASPTQMKMLQFACPQICTQNFETVNLCFQKAEKDPVDTCKKFMQCIQEKYRKK